MKHTLYLIIILLALSCKKDSTSHSNEFEASKSAWISYRASVNNSYSYVSYYAAVMGNYVETKITVQNGKVIGRAYTVGTYPQNSQTLQIIKTWTEDASTLNTRAEGQAAITLDDIYNISKTIYLTIDAGKQEILFTADKQGLIAGCGYIPKGCTDVCFIGVNIKDITKL